MRDPHDTVLGGARAEALVHSVLESAAELRLRVSVAVVDERGFDLLVVRGDGASWFTPEVARTKARTAAAFGRPSESLLELRAAHPDLFVLLGVELPFSPTPLPGGVPVQLDDRLVGGLGVSGASPAQDAQLAVAAVSALARPGQSLGQASRPPGQQPR
ncbi:MAG: GlcG/HbpS family heme-binding protein [Terrabacter sp.]